MRQEATPQGYHLSPTFVTSDNTCGISRKADPLQNRGALPFRQLFSYLLAGLFTVCNATGSSRHKDDKRFKGVWQVF